MSFCRLLVVVTAVVVTAVVAAALLPQPVALAQEPVALSCPPPEPLRAPRAVPVSEAGRLQIQAGRFVASQGQQVHFRDGVELEQDGQRLRSEELIYDPRDGLVRAPGWLEYHGPTLNFSADQAQYDSRQRRGHFSALRYALPGTTAHGSAEYGALVDAHHARLERFDFTTCPPEQVDWQLQASVVDMNLESGVGVARNARLSFKGVPLLYVPWLSFPLDDRRKTGFLYPGFGYSTDDGFDLTLPWYWNISPNQDATLSARWIEKRGVMLGLEHRFLTPRQRGELHLDWLPDDHRAGRDRHFAEFEYRYRPRSGWLATMDIKRVSDNRYFSDLSRDLHGAAIQSLRSAASLRGDGRYWSLELMVDTFQLLDDRVHPSREPYRRLPRVLLTRDQPLPGGLRLSLEAEAVHFDRATGPTGSRLDVFPRLHYDLVAPGWFLRPTLGLRSTAWELRDAGHSSLDRHTPIATLDAGLVFERMLDSGRMQTLEPRVYYLYVPWRDQEAIPEFDTRELTFGYSQMFHYNRFSGADRQGDANQLTVALSSRLLDAEDGYSRLSASIGQIVHFSDRRVQLGQGAPDERQRSFTAAEVAWRPARQLALAAGLQWDSDAHETRLAQFGLNWSGQDAREVALGYRFRRNWVDQADLRFRYPIRTGFNLVGRVTYSFEEHETLELLGGIEYDSCCWALRLTAREWIRDRESDKRTAFFVEFELKGLGSLGRPPYPLFHDRPW